jgi:hypothetical protein
MARDWIGLWFEIQAERGHSDEVPFFLAHLTEAKFEDFGFRHREKDGVAALSGLFTKLGLENTRARRELRRPPWFAVPGLLWRGLAGNGGSGKPNWRSLRPEVAQKPKAFAFLVLREKEEQALAAYLSVSRVSLTAYLLSKLSLAMEPELLAGPVAGSWLLPVDMRPAFPERPLSGNCVSYVKVAASRDAGEIHRQVKRALGAFEHWSNWWVYHIGKVVGLRGMRKLSRRSSERVFWLGSFTDLGDWTPAPSAQADRYRDSVWAIAAPGTPNNPVGCATVAWFGQRSISLRIHPSLSEDPGIAPTILRRLAKMIAADTGSAEAGLLELPIGEKEKPRS